MNSIVYDNIFCTRYLEIGNYLLNIEFLFFFANKALHTLCSCRNQFQRQVTQRNCTGCNMQQPPMRFNEALAETDAQICTDLMRADLHKFVGH